MCHPAGSAPADPPGAATAVHPSDVLLTSADGARFMAYHARPDRATGRGAVILPDFRGLNAFYKEFARKLAGAGVAALAIDYYGRELPDGPRDGSLAEMLPLLMRLTPEQVAADARAAADRLRSAGVAAVFALGFCYGGSQAWNQSAFDAGLAGCAGLYGRPGDCRPYLDRMRVPLLLLVAGDDAMTPVADFDTFDGELAAAGVPHEMVVYEGAPHGFLDAGVPGHHAARADAWRRLLGFIDRNANRPVAAS